MTLPSNIQIEPFFSEQDPLQSHSLQFMPGLVRKKVKEDLSNKLHSKPCKLRTALCNQRIFVLNLLGIAIS